MVKMYNIRNTVKVVEKKKRKRKYSATVLPYAIAFSILVFYHPVHNVYIIHFYHILTHCTSCCYYVIQSVLFCTMCFTQKFFYLLYILDIPPIRYVFQVTQMDPRSSLVMADYCRNT
jgi:hypothetical protein